MNLVKMWEGSDVSGNHITNVYGHHCFCFYECKNDTKYRFLEYEISGNVWSSNVIDIGFINV